MFGPNNWKPTPYFLKGRLFVPPSLSLRFEPTGTKRSKSIRFQLLALPYYGVNGALLSAAWVVLYYPGLRPAKNFGSLWCLLASMDTVKHSRSGNTAKKYYSISERWSLLTGNVSTNETSWLRVRVVQSKLVFSVEMPYVLYIFLKGSVKSSTTNLPNLKLVATFGIARRRDSSRTLETWSSPTVTRFCFFFHSPNKISESAPVYN